MRRVSRLNETGRPARASRTTTPTGEVSTRASRSARARRSLQWRSGRRLAVSQDSDPIQLCQLARRPRPVIPGSQTWLQAPDRLRVPERSLSPVHAAYLRVSTPWCSRGRAPGSGSASVEQNVERAGTTVDAGLRRQPAPLIPRGNPRPGRAWPSARCDATLRSGDQRYLGDHRDHRRHWQPPRGALGYRDPPERRDERADRRQHRPGTLTRSCCPGRAGIKAVDPDWPVCAAAGRDDGHASTSRHLVAGHPGRK